MAEYLAKIPANNKKVTKKHRLKINLFHQSYNSRYNNQ